MTYARIFLLLLNLVQAAFNWFKKQEYITDGMHRQATLSMEKVREQVKVAMAHGAHWKSMSHDERMRILEEAGDFRD